VSACSPGKVGSAGNDEAFDALGVGVAVGVAVGVGVAVAVAMVGAAASAGADAVGAGATGGCATDVVAHRFEEEHPEATSESPSAQMKRW
jgi:hypothetical protein